MTTKKALIIGIENYYSSPLKGPVNDAKVISELLARNDDFDASKNFEVRTGLNVNTRSELMAMIDDLFKGNDDVALFYFSGHGYLNEIGGYIVTPDHKRYEEGVSMEQIQTIAFNSAIKDKIIILDCCHSGAFGTPKLSGKKIAQLIEGMVILTASRDTEEAFEINGRGIFTGLLIDALMGGAADILGQITPGGIYAYIDQTLGPWSQRPVFKTNVTRFTLLRKVKPALSLSTIRNIVNLFPLPEEEFQLDPSYEYTNNDMAQAEKILKFHELQRMARVGLVVPVGEEHMYYAAQNRKSCRLTELGKHYWRLVKNDRV